MQRQLIVECFHYVRRSRKLYVEFKDFWCLFSQEDLDDLDIVCVKDKTTEEEIPFMQYDTWSDLRMVMKLRKKPRKYYVLQNR